jgi:hypothetical protein
MMSAEPIEVAIARRANAARLAESFQYKCQLIAVLEEQIRRLNGRLGQATHTVAITDRITTNQADKQPAPADQVKPTERGLGERRRPSGWPMRQPVGLRPNAGSFNHALNARPTATVCFDVRGNDRDALQRKLDEICRKQGETKSFSPLFLYDGSDFDLFRKHGYVVEWLPNRHNQALRPDIDWAAETDRRIALILSKWAIAQLVDMRPATDSAATAGQQP